MSCPTACLLYYLAFSPPAAEHCLKTSCCFFCCCRHERARAVTTVFGGLDVGSAVGLLLCGPLIRWFGWQSVFYLFAALGFVWCALWPLCRPEQQDPDLPYRMIWKQQQREAGGWKQLGCNGPLVTC